LEAQERNRDEWLSRLAHWDANQLVFIDKSVLNKRSADRRTGWQEGSFCQATSPLAAMEHFASLHSGGLHSLGYNTALIHKGNIQRLHYQPTAAIMQSLSRAKVGAGYGQCTHTPLAGQC